VDILVDNELGAGRFTVYWAPEACIVDSSLKTSTRALSIATNVRLLIYVFFSLMII